MSASDVALDRERRKLEIIETARSKPARFTDQQVTLAHGAGGRATRALVEGLLVPAFDSPTLAELDDAAPVPGTGAKLAITTDTYVVRPIRFPGGSIGELAVNGAVNDLAVAGARPLAVSVSLVLEEGLAADELRSEVEAIAAAAARAEVEVVAGDTKVVERGRADKMYICTTGVGARDPRAHLAPSAIEAGDRILLSGTIGDHGTAVMLARGEFDLAADVESDTRPLWPVAEALIGAAGGDLRCMRDATRGGVASVVNELARASGVSMLVRESAVPVRPPVAGAAELLGIDPLHVANEGKLLAFVAPDAAAGALRALRSVPGCEEAVEIGEATAEAPGMVLVETPFGGRRVMDELVGDPLPRIC
ncbi:MAG TPA: hydrogenase expression/formation protein HypE [Solirubrobacterales bacterium]|nr:hydrogenase expression/formation protein HypE [Solirubrobacterales bacterium]